MNDISETNTPKKRRPSIGVEATRRREQLQRMNDAEQRRRLAFREQNEQLAKELAEVEVHERRDRRKNELKEQQQVCYLLGGLVLEAIRAMGMTKFSLGSSDLDRLKTDKFALLELVVERQGTPSSTGSAQIKSLVDCPPSPPDIAL